jgi:hypothetical protein
MSTLVDRVIDITREYQLRYMTDSVVILRPFKNTVDTTPGVLASNVACRLTPGAGRYQVIADRFDAITPWTLTFPWDTDIQVGDTVIAGDDNTYQVRWADDADKTLRAAVRVLADRIT